MSGPVAHDHDLTGDLVRWADEGNFDAAELILRYAREGLEKSQSVDKTIALYLVRCFERIASGISAEDALNLRQPKGRPSTRRRDVEIAAYVAYLRSKGKSAKLGQIEVAETSGLKLDAVRKICQRYRNEAKQECSFWLRMEQSNPDIFQTIIESFHGYIATGKN